jgi:hypothetical protein
VREPSHLPPTCLVCHGVVVWWEEVAGGRRWRVGALLCSSLHLSSCARPCMFLSACARIVVSRTLDLYIQATAPLSACVSYVLK